MVCRDRVYAKQTTVESSDLEAIMLSLFLVYKSTLHPLIHNQTPDTPQGWPTLPAERPLNIKAARAGGRMTPYGYVPMMVNSVCQARELLDVQHIYFVHDWYPKYERWQTCSSILSEQTTDLLSKANAHCAALWKPAHPTSPQSPLYRSASDPDICDALEQGADDAPMDSPNTHNFDHELDALPRGSTSGGSAAEDQTWDGSTGSGLPLFGPATPLIEDVSSSCSGLRVSVCGEGHQAGSGDTESSLPLSPSTPTLEDARLLPTGDLPTLAAVSTLQPTAEACSAADETGVQQDMRERAAVGNEQAAANNKRIAASRSEYLMPSKYSKGDGKYSQCTLFSMALCVRALSPA